MTLLFVLLSFSISPADSVKTLVSIRNIPEAAVYYSQMAAGENGAWLLELGRILEASGRFAEAGRVYGIALGNSTSSETSDWLINRRIGTAPLDTTIVVTAEVTNTGQITARDIQVILPVPVSHPPFQTLIVLSSDFNVSESGDVLTAHIPCLPPGSTSRLSISLGIIQQPHSARPIPESLSDETVNWITATIRSMPVPDALPGPCVPMSEEMKRLAAEQGMEMSVVGGIILDRTGCIFHAWNVLDEYQLRIDPLLFKEDSLLSIAHDPADVIPLWDLGITDGYELNLLYSNPRYEISGTMKAETR